jgi:hypothetical protein
MQIAGPATEETWVGDADGDPVMVLTAAPLQSLDETQLGVHDTNLQIQAVIEIRDSQVEQKRNGSPAVLPLLASCPSRAAHLHLAISDHPD